ncbi:MAG: glycosyltransferase family 2 protein [Bacteroidales bacterium]|nr:glycosyltransferase family 2 protein [Bacteroidales bacterium]
MEKRLSIIIPSYNMAHLLPRCLDSLIASGVPEAFEAIVVNDGSKDDTLEVALRYRDAHPECIRVIDKPNGNYGSTINAALPQARGKYVKILDADDWFSSEALAKFVDELAGTDADMVVTHFTQIHPKGVKELAKYNLYGKEPYEYGKTYPLDEVLSGGYIRFFLMHSLTYKTELLLKNGYRQTEGCSYTDLEWDVYPLFYSRDIVFFDTNLYQYNLDREGQTMDPKVLSRSLDQLGRVTENILGFYEKYPREQLSPERKAFLDQFYRNRIRLMAKSYLLDLPRDMFDAQEFAKVDVKLQEHMEKLGLEPIKLFPANKIIRVDAYKYWKKHRSRLPKALEAVNSAADKIMTSLYRVIFR